MQLLLVLRVDVLQLRIVVVGVGESAPLTDMRRLLITALSTSQVYQVKSSSQVKSSQVKSCFSRLGQVKSVHRLDLTDLTLCRVRVYMVN